MSALIGTWQIVKAELAGEEMPPFVAGKIEFELGADTYVVRFAGDVSDRGTYAVSPESQPKAIRLTGLEGANAGRCIPAIYQLVGDRLRICYGLDGIPPTVFATDSRQKHYLATYRRKS